MKQAVMKRLAFTLVVLLAGAAPAFAQSSATPAGISAAEPAAKKADTPKGDSPGDSRKTGGEQAVKPAANPAANSAEKPATGKKLPDRWWDAPSCNDMFQQSLTPLPSAVRLNSNDLMQTYRIVWLKIQRRLNGIKIGGPYVVPCRNRCTVGPSGQTEILIDPADFPDEKDYEETERRDIGCVVVEPPKRKR